MDRKEVVRRKRTPRSGGATIMVGDEGEEREEVKTSLPKEMVEKIIAMAPFPSIFTAQTLSKSWRARFSSISSLEDDQEKKRLAASFQKQVIDEWSKNWETFCPVFIGKEDLIAYGQSSHKWRRISLSFLPEILLRSSRYIGKSLDRYHLQIDGALLYGFTRSEIGFHEYELYVADILTQRWKQLPPRPNPNLSFVVCSKIVSNVSLGTYKVLLFCQDDCRSISDLDLDLDCLHGHEHYSAQIYDSKSDAWSIQTFAVTSDFFFGASTTDVATSGAYLNGILYLVAFNNPQNFLAFNLAEGTLEELPLEFNERDRVQVEYVHLLVCNGNCLMMVTLGFPEIMQVLKVDLHGRQLLQMSRGPPRPFRAGNMAPKPVSHGECVFFRHRNQVLVYNVDEEKWSSFPIPPPVAPIDHEIYKWIGNSFQPGLSPFVAL